MAVTACPIGVEPRRAGDAGPCGGADGADGAEAERIVVGIDAITG